MKPFRTFEEIEGWKMARSLTRDLYRATRDEPFAEDPGLGEQMRRSAISITSNIAAGVEHQRRPADFLRYLRRAKGAAGGVRSQLFVALDQGYVDEDTFQKLSADATSTINLIAGLIHYLRTR